MFYFFDQKNHIEEKDYGLQPSNKRPMRVPQLLQNLNFELCTK